MSKKQTVFVDNLSNRLASEEGILPLPLKEGMIITIHGYEERFEVMEWMYHHGHEDENAGLIIVLRRIEEPSVPDVH